MIHRGASLITSGDLVVAQARFTKRVPGTGNVLGSRWNSVLLLRPEKLHTAPDIETALNWLNRIRTVAEKVEKAGEDKNSDKKELKEDERELADYFVSSTWFVSSPRAVRVFRTSAISSQAIS